MIVREVVIPAGRIVDVAKERADSDESPLAIGNRRNRPLNVFVAKHDVACVVEEHHKRIVTRPVVIWDVVPEENGTVRFETI